MNFSVLMSVYKNDKPEFLKAALESIYEKQTVKPDQIVIVRDGPVNSDVKDVIDEFGNRHSSVVCEICLDKNGGLGAALETGLKYCRNEWVARMDSDDISAPDRFEKQLEYIMKNPGIDVIGGNISEFSESTDEDNMRVRKVPEDHEGIVKMAKKRNPMNHVSVMMKKSSVLKSGGYQSLLLLEDYYLWLNMLASGCRFANINENLVYVRAGDSFNVRRSDKKRLAGWRVLQDFMLENNMITKREAAMNMVYIHGFVYCPPFVKKIAYNKFLRK